MISSVVGVLVVVVVVVVVASERGRAHQVFPVIERAGHVKRLQLAGVQRGQQKLSVP